MVDPGSSSRHDFDECTTVAVSFQERLARRWSSSEALPGINTVLIRVSDEHNAVKCEACSCPCPEEPAPLLHGRAYPSLDRRQYWGAAGLDGVTLAHMTDRLGTAGR